MKPKQNRKSDKTKHNTMDYCRTPPYAVEPLVPYLPPTFTVWESCCGEHAEHFLLGALERREFDVIGTDILHGIDYFSWEPQTYDIQITNPPYSIKYDWIQRAYDLGKPFALLIPLETIGSARAQHMAQTYGAEFILLDKRVDFFMPNKGYGGSAQFPVMWWTHGLGIGRDISYAKLHKPPKSRTAEDAPLAAATHIMKEA